jgi:DNA repair exonuclease SbcCD nuclease subunit
MKILHTSDWQLGKPYARVTNPTSVALLQHERIAVIQRIGAVALEKGCSLIVVAGDMFDSSSVEKATVFAACAAIAQTKLPVYIIPGNHDHAGAGGIWGQSFFNEVAANCPNLMVLDKPVPAILNDVVIFPCPLIRRQDAGDVLEWLYSPDVLNGIPKDRPWVVLAHGSTQGFSSASGEDAAGQSNLIELSRLDMLNPDYVALGDWHGTKQVSKNAWYSGTPEPDRFTKGGDHDPGNVLVVEVAGRGVAPQVEVVRTAGIQWHRMDFDFSGDDSLTHFETKLSELLGQRAQRDVMELSLSGYLGFTGDERLRRLLETLDAQLLRLKLVDGVRIVPSDAELMQLTQRDDPLISAMANRLTTDVQSLDPVLQTQSRLALRELYLLVTKGGSAA